MRGRTDDTIALLTYGRSSGFCVDPIEKKPLNHFLPGSEVLSFGTAGCNLACRFCQNWGISKSRRNDTLAVSATPEAIAATAERLGCESVAFTYNDPVVFLEYAVDVARACHERHIMTVAVTAGYVCPGPRAELFAHVDAANVDLKSFDDGFYRRTCAGSLQPVLDTLEYIVAETAVWLELTTLLIPGLNDSDEELDRMTSWGVEQLGPDVPWHFTAFHPDYRMLEVPATPLETLLRARSIARANGVRYAYTGNVVGIESGSTWCPGCDALLIERDGYRVGTYALTADGCCTSCGMQTPGIFERVNRR